jgi:phage FluMu protein Com
MSAKVRCKSCGKLLGELSGDPVFDIQPVACQATSTDLIFTIKCPRCGKFNFIKIRPND